MACPHNRDRECRRRGLRLQLRARSGRGAREVLHGAEQRREISERGLRRHSFANGTRVFGMIPMLTTRVLLAVALLTSISCNRAVSMLPPPLPPPPGGIFVTHSAVDRWPGGSGQYAACAALAREVWEQRLVNCVKSQARSYCRHEAAELHKQYMASCEAVR